MQQKTTVTTRESSHLCNHHKLKSADVLTCLSFSVAKEKTYVIRKISGQVGCG